jgi:4-hydroxyacetophenone monooxygenase
MSVQPTETDPADDELRAALNYANIPTLIMTLAYLTGDHSWLEPPYRPTRTVALEDNDTGGLSEERQAEVRDAARRVVEDWRRGDLQVPDPPGDAEIVEILSVGMGETVPEEYGAMMAEEVNFRPRDPKWSDGPPTERLAKFHVIVVGAGISGICTAIKLRSLGIPHTVIEKNDAVGGTWLENDYPGAGVDTPSHLYSYSFNPSYTWTRYYAKQPEILGYINATAEQYGVTGAIRFGREVTIARFDVDEHKWHVTVSDKEGVTEELVADAVITSVGQLNRPAYPTVEGLESFGGPVFHSARWRHDVDIEGKRVAVFGTGASAMQVVPAIAGRPADLLVFQRSPQWVAPNKNYLRSVDDGTRAVMEQLPYYAMWYRVRLLWMFNDKLYPTLRIDRDWPHPERSVNAANDRHRVFFTEHIRRLVDEQSPLWKDVLPTYPPYGKRILMDNGWYETIQRDDVQLITDQIDHVEPGAVVTADGTRHEVDVIVFATGFQSRRVLYPMDIRGSTGASLRDIWGEDDARAYLGMTVPDFPNLFIVFGPNTNLGHGGSVIFHTECQVNYITRLLMAMVEDGLASVECRRDVFEDYNTRVDAAHEEMIWSHRGMNTWYRNAKGRVVTNTPWRLLDYWRFTRNPDLADFILTPAEHEVPAT